MRFVILGLALSTFGCALRYAPVKPAAIVASDGREAAWPRALALLADEGYLLDGTNILRADGFIQTGRSVVGVAKCSGTNSFCHVHETVTVVISPDGTVRVRIHREIGTDPWWENSEALVASVTKREQYLAKMIALPAP